MDPQLKLVADPQYVANPLSWTDFRTKMTIIPALGDLPCPESKAFLLQYLALDGATAREIAPLLFEDATRALMRQQLRAAEIEALLRNANSGVRGTALAECVDHPSRERREALRAAAPWALELPRAKR